jgi:hypothetical protein
LRRVLKTLGRELQLVQHHNKRLTNGSSAQISFPWLQR